MIETIEVKSELSSCCNAEIHVMFRQNGNGKSNIPFCSKCVKYPPLNGDFERNTVRFVVKENALKYKHIYSPYSEIVGQPFFLDDTFYSSHEEYIQDLSESMTPELLKEDFGEIVEGSSLQPIIDFNDSAINNMAEALYSINEERFSEHSGEEEVKKIEKALKESIDFEKLNLLMPKLYYPSGKKYVIEKKDVYDDLVREFEE